MIFLSIKKYKLLHLLPKIVQLFDPFSLLIYLERESFSKIRYVTGM